MIIDITMKLGPDTPVYPGDPPVSLVQLSAARGGDTFALSRLMLGSHAGTHVDAPAHFLAGGATVEETPLAACIGLALVLDLRGGAGPITPAELAGLPDEIERVLLRTAGPPANRPTANIPPAATPSPDGPQADGLPADGPPGAGRPLSLAATRLLVERGVRLVGIDALSVAPPESPGAVHRLLLAAGVVILEGLDLRAAPPGAYTLLCLPLKLMGGDGAPARAVLLTEPGLPPPE